MELHNCSLDKGNYLIIDNSSVQVGEEVIDVFGYDSDGRPLICNDTNSSGDISMDSFQHFPVGFIEIYTV